MIIALLEHIGGRLPKAAWSTAAAALAAKREHNYGRTVGLLIGGADVGSAAQVAAELGLDEIVFVSGAHLENYLALSYEAVIREVLRSLSPQLFLLSGTSLGKDLAPRVAELLSAGQASEVTAFLPERGYRRLMYAGNVIAEVELSTERHVATVRLTAFPATEKAAQPSPVRELTVQTSTDVRQEFNTFATTESKRPELTEADVVISGGRALRSAENFEKYLSPLADVLGAAIGASRAAVDAGYAPNDLQVGQTGKIVAPSLYIAVGISGAIQHLAGMKDSKTIVAINKDADAPIFEFADYGLAGDLFEILPQLTEEIRKLKS